MNKKILRSFISIILVIAMLNFIGCYTQQQLSADNYNFDKNDNISVITEDTVYTFSGEKCSIKNDTLFYKISVPLDQRRMQIKTMKMPLDQIDKIEVEKLDGLKTTLIIVGVLVATFIVIGIATIDLPYNK